ncbi:MAG: hypothetical protein ACREVG_04725 [Burkholderiales bacterium]
MSVTDSGGTANGGIDSSALQTFTITVNPVNDAPVAANRVLAVVGSSPVVIGIGDLGYADADGDSLSNVTITALPGSGVLKLDANPVTANQVIGAADLAAGKLRYFPPTASFELRLAGFDFRVSDGTLDSVSTYTISLSLQPSVVTTASSIAPSTETPLPSPNAVPATASAAPIPVVIRIAESGAGSPGSDGVDGGSVLLSANFEPTPANPAGAASASGTGSGATSTGTEASQARNAVMRHEPIAQPPASALAEPLALGAEIQRGTLTETSDTRTVASVTRNPAFIEELDRLRRGVQAEADLEQRVIASSIAVGAGISIGYVLWLLRGGVLLTSLLSSLPAWRFVDPLPVLARLGGGNDDDDDESLESIVAGDAGAHPPAAEEPDNG